MEKLDKITNYPKPKTVVELRRFLEMVNYYRRCMSDAAKLQAPLNDYLKNSKKNDKTQIIRTKLAENAFEDTKNSLVTITKTALLSPSAPITLTTNASSTAIGASLEQFENGIWRLIGFFYRKLSETEQRYATYDRELLAIFSEIKHFHHLLECNNLFICSYAEIYPFERCSVYFWDAGAKSIF